jgi:glucan biosynthesis protein C
VIAHHTALAYLAIPTARYATLLTPPRLWLIFPVMDTHHWALAGLLVAFNDTFFMSLMFLLSGLFFYSGLTRKGTASFLRNRFLRLGIPFVIAAGLFSLQCSL